MPTGTQVDKQYQAIKKSELASGADKKTAKRIAAATAQKRTHQSLATGKKLPRKK